MNTESKSGNIILSLTALVAMIFLIYEIGGSIDGMQHGATVNAL